MAVHVGTDPAAVYIGDQAATVYVGDQQVWPPVDPPAQTMNVGVSVGDHDGWGSVTNWISWVGQPQVLRVYQASYPAQLVEAATTYPTVPLIFGPRSLDNGWGDTERRECLDRFVTAKAASGTVRICPNPEWDVKILNVGNYDMDDVVDDMEAWRALIDNEYPTLTTDLWANIAGYNAHQNSRLTTYIPGGVRDVVDGIAGDLYSYHADGPSGGDCVGAMEAFGDYADTHNLRVSFFENGAELGTDQAAQYQAQLEAAWDMGAEDYCVWNTVKTGGGTGGANLDCRLSEASQDVFTGWIEDHS